MRRHFSKVWVTVTLPPQPKIQEPVPQLPRFQRLWPSPRTFTCAGSLRLRNGCQVWVWRSSGQGQGQRGQKACLSILFVVSLSLKKGPSEGNLGKLKEKGEAHSLFLLPPWDHSSYCYHGVCVCGSRSDVYIVAAVYRTYTCRSVCNAPTFENLQLETSFWCVGASSD